MNARLGALVSTVCVLVLTTSGCASRQEPAAEPTSRSHLSSADTAGGYCTAAYQARFGWPDPAKAARVCACESNGNPRAGAATGRYVGLFQFARATWKSVGGGDPFDPARNSEQAYRLYRRQGWRPWPVCGR